MNSYQLIKLHIKPSSPFVTLPVGDMLFGQLCWAIREHAGEAHLETLLQGYPAGQPFCVVSDWLPSDYIPKPFLPKALGVQDHENNQSSAKQKDLKKRKHLPLHDSDKKCLSRLPLDQWIDHAENKSNIWVEHYQSHNSINRLTNTTGEDGFAPFGVRQYWADLSDADYLSCYAVIDANRFSVDELKNYLTYIGQIGFGKDASTGAGKFSVHNYESDFSFQNHPQSNAYITLAACSPYGDKNSNKHNQLFNSQQSYYDPVVRFGRHGNVYGLSEKPFKNPILLANTGGLFRLKDGVKQSNQFFIGCGLGGFNVMGHGELSEIEPKTIHQGYAPIVPVFMSCL
jgi:CRISPR-associated protein Csm4